MTYKLIDLASMSERGRLIAEGIILRIRRKEIINRSAAQPEITKQRLYSHLQKTIRENNRQLSGMEQEGICSFFDYCNHYCEENFERGECLHAHCESFIYPLNFFAWLDWWCRKQPQDEDCFFAIFRKFGSYPRYSIR